MINFPNLSFYANFLINRILKPQDLTQPYNQELSGSISRELKAYISKYSFRYDSHLDCLDSQQSKSLEQLRKAFSEFSKTGDLESSITDDLISLPGSKKRPTGLTVRSVLEETQSFGYRDEVLRMKKSLNYPATISFLPPINPSSEKFTYCDYKERSSALAKAILTADQELRDCARDRRQYLRDELIEEIGDTRLLPSEAF